MAISPTKFRYILLFTLVLTLYSKMNRFGILIELLKYSFFKDFRVEMFYRLKKKVQIFLIFNPFGMEQIVFWKVDFRHRPRQIRKSKFYKFNGIWSYSRHYF